MTERSEGATSWGFGGAVSGHVYSQNGSSRNILDEEYPETADRHHIMFC